MALSVVVTFSSFVVVTRAAAAVAEPVLPSRFHRRPKGTVHFWLISNCVLRRVRQKWLLERYGLRVTRFAQVVGRQKYPSDVISYRVWVVDLDNGFVGLYKQQLVTPSFPRRWRTRICFGILPKAQQANSKLSRKSCSNPRPGVFKQAHREGKSHPYLKLRLT